MFFFVFFFFFLSGAPNLNLFLASVSSRFLVIFSEKSQFLEPSREVPFEVSFLSDAQNLFFGCLNFVSKSCNIPYQKMCGVVSEHTVDASKPSLVIGPTRCGHIFGALNTAKLSLADLGKASVDPDEC